MSDCCCCSYALSDSVHFNIFYVYLVLWNSAVALEEMRLKRMLLGICAGSSKNLATFLYLINWWLFNFFFVSTFSMLISFVFQVLGPRKLANYCLFVFITLILDHSIVEKTG